ncbi:cytochrome P450 [Geobacter sp.]|uniref:cytochrome P450 n=1 Tax=Geobacter sp. TaxID=46610 RepID=UPI0027B94DD0|nr:cytochrome P450 [Geobacter sp.]
MDGPAKIPTVSLVDSLIYNLVHVIPSYLRGLFTPNRFWFTFWTAIHPDPASVKFITRLRKKYRSNYCYLRMLTTKSLVVLDPDGIRHVLDNSPDIYADAKLKRDGMAHFQPDSVTISRGDQWRERRRFNESVLETGHDLHRYGKDFLDVIRDETATMLKGSGGHLVWEDFAVLFERITMQVIFGAGVRDTSMTETLRQMMLESNRGFALSKSKHFDDFYAAMRRHRQEARGESLAALCNSVPSTAVTKVDNQITHWMFAMGETLAINTVRALALIAAHPAADERVRDEMGREDLSSPEGIDRLKYLEGCVQEAMRLWPTTPILVRETVKEDVLGGATIPAGTQVIIINSFSHRDRETLPFADTFSPDVWLSDSVDYRFNHLSNGPQGCAGKELALFIAKAAIATLFTGQRYTVERPPLDPSRPLPYLYNHYQLRLKRRDA